MISSSVIDDDVTIYYNKLKPLKIKCWLCNNCGTPDVWYCFRDRVVCPPHRRHVFKKQVAIEESIRNPPLSAPQYFVVYKAGAQKQQMPSISTEITYIVPAVPNIVSSPVVCFDDFDESDKEDLIASPVINSKMSCLPLVPSICPISLAFEIDFILSLDRVLRTVVYPGSDPVHHFSSRFVTPSDTIPFCFKSRIMTKFELSVLLQIGCVEPNPGPRGHAPVVHRYTRKPRVHHPYRPSRKGRYQIVPCNQHKPRVDRFEAPNRYVKPNTFRDDFFKWMGHTSDRLKQHGATLHISFKGKQRRFGFDQDYKCWLQYTLPIQTLTGGGVINSFRLSTNAYDVDSALASTTMPMFSELAALFKLFRTAGGSYDFEVTNNENAINVTIIHGVSTTSVGSTSLGANYSGNKNIKTDKMAGWKGMGVQHRVSGKFGVGDMFGEKMQAKADDLFTGSTTSSTLSSNKTVYIYIGGIWQSVPVLGMSVQGHVRLYLKFSNRTLVTAREKEPKVVPNSCCLASYMEDNDRNPYPLDPYQDWWDEDQKRLEVSPEERITNIEDSILDNTDKLTLLEKKIDELEKKNTELLEQIVFMLKNK